MLRLLLTSAGVRNPSIHKALFDLLGKPIADASASASPRRRMDTRWPVLADLLPSLRETVWGLSAGSMVLTPRIGQDFVAWKPPTGSDSTLGAVEVVSEGHWRLFPDSAEGHRD